MTCFFQNYCNRSILESNSDTGHLQVAQSHSINIQSPLPSAYNEIAQLLIASMIASIVIYLFWIIPRRLHFRFISFLFLACSIAFKYIYSKNIKE
jgi:hypothetical protein